MPRIVVWPCSARTTATATPTGIASASATNDVATVPKIAGRAPNESVTGFQSIPVRKPNPKCLTEGAACWKRMTMITIRITGTVAAITAVNVRNRSGTFRTAGIEVAPTSMAVAKVSRTR